MSPIADYEYDISFRKGFHQDGKKAPKKILLEAAYPTGACRGLLSDKLHTLVAKTITYYCSSPELCICIYSSARTYWATQ